MRETESRMEQKEIVVYARGRRPSCWRTKRLLRRRGYHFRVVDSTEEVGMRPRLAHPSTRATAPFVFVDGRPVGDLATLRSLDRSGDLGRLVRGEV
jgi:glutaredoxin-related protein